MAEYRNDRLLKVYHEYMYAEKKVALKPCDLRLDFKRKQVYLLNTQKGVSSDGPFSFDP